MVDYKWQPEGDDHYTPVKQPYFVPNPDPQPYSPQYVMGAGEWLIVLGAIIGIAQALSVLLA